MANDFRHGLLNVYNLKAITLWLAGAVVVGLFATEVVLRIWGIEWRYPGSVQPVRHRALGWQYRCGILGSVLLLALPHVASFEVLESRAPSPIIRAEDLRLRMCIVNFDFTKDHLTSAPRVAAIRGYVEGRSGRSTFKSVLRLEDTLQFA